MFILNCKPEKCNLQVSSYPVPTLQPPPAVSVAPCSACMSVLSFHGSDNVDCVFLFCRLEERNAFIFRVTYVLKFWRSSEVLVTSYNGRAMVQVVSRRPLTAEARFRALDNPCGICGGQSGTGTGFFSEFFGFPLWVSFHRRSPYACIIWGKRNLVA
jgi:hypothetical protein